MFGECNAQMILVVFAQVGFTSYIPTLLRQIPLSKHSSTGVACVLVRPERVGGTSQRCTVFLT